MTAYDPDAILAAPDAHPVHKRYAAINVGVRDRGEQWAKCLDCGEPFQSTAGIILAAAIAAYPFRGNLAALIEGVTT